MTLMIDTEDGYIPRNEYGNPEFDLFMADHLDGEGPWIVLGVPEYFECWNGEVYDSCGALHCKFKDLLEDHIAEIYSEVNCGDEEWSAKAIQGGAEFSSYLRSCAERIDAMLPNSIDKK